MFIGVSIPTALSIHRGHALQDKDLRRLLRFQSETRVQIRRPPPDRCAECAVAREAMRLPLSAIWLLPELVELSPSYPQFFESLEADAVLNKASLSGQGRAVSREPCAKKQKRIRQLMRNLSNSDLDSLSELAEIPAVRLEYASPCVQMA